MHILNDRVIPTAFQAQTQIMQETGGQNPTALLEVGFINAFDKYIGLFSTALIMTAYMVSVFTSRVKPIDIMRTIIARKEFVKVLRLAISLCLNSSMAPRMNRIPKP